MAISSITHRCDWPGCEKALTLDVRRCLDDYDWEFRCGGVKVVCDEHRFKTSKELEDEVRAESPLPCPFCGGFDLESCRDDGFAWVRCKDCGATGPREDVVAIGPNEQRGAAYRAWNRRDD